MSNRIIPGRDEPDQDRGINFQSVCFVDSDFISTTVDFIAGKFDFSVIRDQRAEVSRPYSSFATEGPFLRGAAGGKEEGRNKEIAGGVAARHEEDCEERSRGISSAAGRAFRAAFLRRDFAVRRAGVGLESTVSQDATVSCNHGDILANDLAALDSPPPPPPSLLTRRVASRVFPASRNARPRRRRSDAECRFEIIYGFTRYNTR